jgi:hypothetical protein
VLYGARALKIHSQDRMPLHGTLHRERISIGCQATICLPRTGGGIRLNARPWIAPSAPIASSTLAERQLAIDRVALRSLPFAALYPRFE